MQPEEARYERNPDFVLRWIVEELILIPVRQGRPDMDCIYTLNPVGAFIWGKLDGHRTLVDVQECILQEYDSDPQAVAADLVEFVQELESVGAVRRV